MIDPSMIANRGYGRRRSRVALVAAVAVVLAGGSIGWFVITDEPSSDPSHAEILFAQVCGGLGGLICREPTDLFIVDGEGRTRRIVDGGAMATWSPDGTKIAYVDARGLVIARADGAQSEVIVACRQPNCTVTLEPDWSPDGSTIVFAREIEAAGGRDLSLELWLVAPDGSGLRQLTGCRPAACSGYHDPTWAPDGHHVAAWTAVPCEGEFRARLEILSTDREERRTLIDCVGIGAFDGLDWSPTADQIVTAAAAGGAKEIDLIDAGTGARTRITSCKDEGCSIAFPSWSPDGRWIVFTRYTSLLPDEVRGSIAILDRSGEGLQLVDAQGISPAWRPGGA